MRFSAFWAKHRTPALIVALLVPTILAVLCLPRLHIGEVRTGWIDNTAISAREFELFRSTFKAGEEVVIAYDLPAGLTRQELEWQRQFIDTCSQLDGVRRIQSLVSLLPLFPDDSPMTPAAFFSRFPAAQGVLLSNDGRTTAIILSIGRTSDSQILRQDSADALLDSLMALTGRASASRKDRVRISSAALISRAMANGIAQDIATFFPAAIMLGAIILFITFRHWVFALFPLLSTAIALCWTFGLKAFFNSPLTPVSSTLFVLITVIGVADAIHLYSHLISKRREGASDEQAITSTLRTAGLPCFWTFAATAFGFLSLLWSPLPAIRDLGIYSAIGVACAFITAIAFMPLAVRLAPRQLKTRPLYGPNAGRIADLSISHGRVILICSLVCAASLIPSIGRCVTDSSLISYLSRNHQVRKDADYIAQHLDRLPSLELVVSAQKGSFTSPYGVALLDSLESSLRLHPDVRSTTSMVSILDAVSQMRGSLLSNDSASIMHAIKLTRFADAGTLRSFVTAGFDTARISIATKPLAPGALARLIKMLPTDFHADGLQVHCTVTGLEKLTHEITAGIVKTQFQSLWSAFLPILLVMLILFGFKGGLCAMAVNTPPILVLFGLMGYGGFPLNIATATIASITIGIVVDDTIHYFFAYRRTVLSGISGVEAIIRTHHETAESILTTSLILILGLLLFLGARSPVMVEFGLLSAIAVATALLSELVLSPALLMVVNPFQKKKPAR